jgi:hypothetical protein
MRPNASTIFIKEIIVQDPDTGMDIEVEIHKDPISGAIFGVDSSYLDQITTTVPSPFSKPDNILWLNMEDNGQKGHP